MNKGCGHRVGNLGGEMWLVWSVFGCVVVFEVDGDSIERYLFLTIAIS
jgi:hypothetical protein